MAMNHRLTIDPAGFRLDGAPFRLLAGAIHYFRVPRAYWRDRLIKLKACGFNAVETYVAWNAHQPRPGVFDYEGMLDIAAFLRHGARTRIIRSRAPRPLHLLRMGFRRLALVAAERR